MTAGQISKLKQTGCVESRLPEIWTDDVNGFPKAPSRGVRSHGMGISKLGTKGCVEAFILRFGRRGIYCDTLNPVWGVLCRIYSHPKARLDLRPVGVRSPRGAEVASPETLQNGEALLLPSPRMKVGQISKLKQARCVESRSPRYGQTK